nr:MAG TPA: hypothetical protein [Caudoviricetes sp.]
MSLDNKCINHGGGLFCSISNVYCKDMFAIKNEIPGPML